MKSYLFIGIDISKGDAGCMNFPLRGSMEIHYHEFSNSPKGFIHLLKWLKEKSEDVAVSRLEGLYGKHRYL